VAWLLPELELGAEPELKPLELELELEPEPVEVEPVELEPVEVELEPVELEDEPELDDVPVDEPDDAEELCVEPGRASATTPAAATLAMVTVVVTDRILARPRSLPPGPGGHGLGLRCSCRPFCGRVFGVLCRKLLGWL
jgi:hypothetical protein